jgi:hypothetical protein
MLNGRQLRSRNAQKLDVPKSVRLVPSLAAALLDDHFEHPAMRGGAREGQEESIARCRFRAGDFD